ncbi:MAG: hypothetical protein J0L63_06615 [Anaerolineae bacterium]|nr:hypothetical protein [Anaerolineae bacterium]
MMKRFPRALWVYALVFALLTSLPYLVGQLSAPAGWQYTGAASIPTGLQFDFASHMAKMWQGSRGQWDYQLLFTHESHPGLPLVQGFYVALGAVARLTPFTLPLVFHIARFLLTIGVVLSIWSLAGRFFQKSSERWLTVIIGTLFSGWSWLLLIISPHLTAQVGPIEFWLIDAFNGLGILYMPHFAAAIILQIVVVIAYDDWVRQGGRKNLSLLTIALALESILQPYVILLLLPLLVLLTAYHIFSAHRLSWQRALWLIIPFAVHALLVLYQFLVLNSDPIWANFTAQNQTHSPDPAYYLFGYLPFVIPIVFGARRFMLEDADDQWWIPVLWIALVAMLIFAPFPTQRRYLLGVQTPLALLAAYGWSRSVISRLPQSARLLGSVLYCTLATVAFLAMIIFNTAKLSQPQQNPELFVQPDEAAGYDWLRQVITPQDLILTTFDEDGTGSGHRLVAALGVRVFLGHWIETADFKQKQALVRQFYTSSTGDEWRQSFLKQTGVTYIWYDESARQQGTWNPQESSYLQPVFTSLRVSIYKVN